MKKLIYCFFLFLLSCSSSFQEEIANLDADGRELSIKITSPSTAFITSGSSVSVEGTAFDQYGIRIVEIYRNGVFYAAAEKKWETLQSWKKEGIPLSTEKNTLCARVTNSAGAAREHCIVVKRNLYSLPDYPLVNAVGFRLGGCISHTDHIICIGGEDNNISDHTETQVSSFYPGTSQWAFSNSTYSNSSLNHIPYPDSAKGFGTTALDGKIYVIGAIQDRQPLDKNLMFDINNNSWNAVPMMNHIRVSPSVNTLEGKIYAFGGVVTIDNYYLATDSVERYDPSTHSWSVLKSLNPSRMGAIALSDGKYIYLIGGIDSQGNILARLDRYDPVQDQWTSLPSMKHARFFAAGGIIKNRYLYIMGGKTLEKEVEYIERFDLETGRWETVGITDFHISESSFCTFDDSIYIFGGRKGNEYTRQSYRYTPFLN